MANRRVEIVLSPKVAEEVGNAKTGTQEERALLPSLGRVREALYCDWALRVKQLDGWKCAMCPSTTDLNAHHWYVSDHHAHAARYCLNDGVTLCYTCHVRAVHTRADWMTISKLHDLAVRRPGFDADEIEELAKTELTVPLLRSMWCAMRARPIKITDEFRVRERGGTIRLHIDNDHQIAAIDNTILVPQLGVCEVSAVVKKENGLYRYNVRPLEFSDDYHKDGFLVRK